MSSSVATPVVSRQSKQWQRRWAVTITNTKVTDSISTGNPDTGFQPIEGIAYDEVMSIEQHDWIPEGMHITFDTTQYALQAYQWCTVVIYNLNAPTSQDLIKYGMTCKVEAGYVDGTFGTIFYGTIFQPMWEKENGTDWKLTLRCVVGIIESSDNVINHNVARGVTQRQLVSQMLGNARYPLSLKMDDFNEDRLTRSTTYFGQPNDFLQYVADSNDALLWFTNMEAHMQALEEDNTVPEKEFGTDNGLVGTPQQTEFGVVLKVLLQPDLIPRGQIKLKQSVVIRQMVRQFGSYPSIITQDYRYIIGSLRHYGDSRGNDWYTEITGFYNADVLLDSLRIS